MSTLPERHEFWSSRLGFLFAAIGFSVGLGNIWRFPYIAGAYGGSAFLFVYVACVLAIGLPLLLTELTIGRRGRGSPTGSIKAVASECRASPAWGHVGTLAVFCVFIILSYYTVLTGWTFDYFFRAASGSFEGIGWEDSRATFDALMHDPARLLFWHTIVNVIVLLIVRRGVRQGVEKAVKLLMPMLLVSLIAMVLYSAVAGDFHAAAAYLLEPDFSKVTFGTVMVATGQAFLSIGIGMAALITFGSYLPRDYSIPRSAVIILIADTAVALLAGFAVFPLVFEFGLEPSSGAGLIFETLPLAFGRMPGGEVFGSIFFILLIAAALSSCVGCGEALVSWIDEHWQIQRRNGIFLALGATWLTGLLSILSLGAWDDFYPLDFIPAFAERTIFDSLDFLAANVLLLVGGLLISLFVGWRIPKRLVVDEIGVFEGALFSLWRFAIRFMIPPLLLVALLLGITE